LSGVSAAIAENTDVANAQPTRRNFFMKPPHLNAEILAERPDESLLHNATSGI
jgi:hypothetical protein